MSFAFIRKRSKNYIVYLEYKDPSSNKKIQKIWVHTIKKRCFQEARRDKR